jgi:hypothetical protein
MNQFEHIFRRQDVPFGVPGFTRSACSTPHDGVPRSHAIRPMLMHCVTNASMWQVLQRYFTGNEKKRTLAIPCSQRGQAKQSTATPLCQRCARSVFDRAWSHKRGELTAVHVVGATLS